LLFSFPVAVAAILIFGSRSTSGNVGQCRLYHIQVGHGRKYGGRSWNRRTISRRSNVISTFGFMAAILNFDSGKMSCNVCRDTFKSGMVDNVGLTVEIATPSLAVQKLVPHPVLLAAIFARLC